RRSTPEATNPKRVAAILAKLDEAYPDAVCELKHANPLQLLISTILSAQCTDVRVNQVTQSLYKKYRDVKAFAYADPAELEQEIRPTGFFRNKTKAIIGASKAIIDKFGGQVPRTMEEILTLPGVARKTANVVLGTGYGIADRKSTRLNSSNSQISYAVFCLKKKRISFYCHPPGWCHTSAKCWSRPSSLSHLAHLLFSRASPLPHVSLACWRPRFWRLSL